MCRNVTCVVLDMSVSVPKCDFRCPRMSVNVPKYDLGCPRMSVNVPKYDLGCPRNVSECAEM